MHPTASDGGAGRLTCTDLFVVGRPGALGALGPQRTAAGVLMVQQEGRCCRPLLRFCAYITLDDRKQVVCGVILYQCRHRKWMFSAPVAI